MAIAGVKPVKIDYLDDDAFIENAWDEPEAEVHCGFPTMFVGYNEAQVRKILVKFSNEYILFIDDDTAEQIVDEFMESGE